MSNLGGEWIRGVPLSPKPRTHSGFFSLPPLPYAPHRVQPQICGPQSKTHPCLLPLFPRLPSWTSPPALQLDRPPSRSSTPALASSKPLTASAPQQPVSQTRIRSWKSLAQSPLNDFPASWEGCPVAHALLQMLPSSRFHGDFQLTPASRPLPAVPPARLVSC